MQFSLFGFRCVRVLSGFSQELNLQDMSKGYDYVFGVSYGFEIPANGYDIQKRQISLIDLRKGIEATFQNFKDNTRKEIRKVERTPEIVLTSDDKNFLAVYKCYTKFELSRNWKPALRSEMKRYIHFTASYKEKDEIIAGVSCYGEKRILRVAKIYSIRNTNNELKYSNALVGSSSRSIIYEICKYGIENGYDFIDLGGINFIDPIKVGISQFKESFGGERFDVFVYRYMTPKFKFFKKILSFLKKDIT